MAIGELEKALALANKMDDLFLKKDCYERLSDANAKLKNYSKAYEYQTIAAKMAADIFDQKSNDAINELETRFETEKKEQQIKSLSQENEIKNLELQRSRIWMIAVSGLALALVVGFFLVVSIIRQKRLKEQQEKVMLEQRLLRSQMNPHFIFNSLIAIQNFILKSNPKEAGHFLTKFSRLMRMVLEHSRMEYVPLEKEIELLRHYLDLQMLRFANVFDYSFNVDEKISTADYEIPPMLAQPFIENAIEHGLSKLDRKGHLSVRFNLDSDAIIFSVEDDGAGLNPAGYSDNSKTHRSFATLITKERLALLNKGKKNRIAFTVEDMRQAGTRTIFSIPFRVAQNFGS
jgi:anti-sigma regulatory factor (Ser/Thr protein kinase)